MATLEIRTHLWPLFVTIVPARFEAEDLKPYIAEVSRLYARKERFATLVDTTAVEELPGAAARRALAEWQNSTVEQIRSYNVCTATVLSSALVRGAMTAMHWLFRPPNEQIAVASIAEGFSFCVDRLVQDRQPLSGELRRLVERERTITLADVLSRSTLRPGAGP
jgi:hypothetical protein